MATDVYEKFDKAFRGVSAFTLHRDGKWVGRMAFKHGNACTCYFHIHNMPMSCGRATGYGYDKASASLSAALHRAPPPREPGSPVSPHELAARELFKLAQQHADCDDGRSWQSRLEAAGFQVCHVFG